MNELQIINNKVFTVRDQRVMVDFQLAEMYGIETRVLKQAVRRNIERFPEDFMFQLTRNESNQLILMGASQIVIPPDYNVGNTFPFVFTEQGIAMLSSVLKSPKAIQINISIMRIFVELRKYSLGYSALKHRLDNIEVEMSSHFSEIYTSLNELNSKPKEKPRPVVGFNQPES
jgi:hypothetical protein